jgi:hypothetical protein
VDDRGEERMKLNLLFIALDFLTLLAYPIVFAHGKLRQFSRSRENIALMRYWVAGAVTVGG